MNNDIRSFARDRALPFSDKISSVKLKTNMWVPFTSLRTAFLPWIQPSTRVASHPGPEHNLSCHRSRKLRRICESAIPKLFGLTHELHYDHCCYGICISFGDVADSSIYSWQIGPFNICDSFGRSEHCICFPFFPTIPNPSLGQMNWNVAIFAVVGAVVALWYMIKGRHTYEPPQRRSKDKREDEQPRDAEDTAGATRKAGTLDGRKTSLWTLSLRAERTSQ